MKNYIKKMVNHPNIPVMSDDGIWTLINYFFENGNWSNSDSGPSRHIMISRPAQDEKVFSDTKKLKLEKSLFKKLV